MKRVAALALILLAPGALALDVLPTETHLSDLDARILVRVAGPSATVRVDADPPVLATAMAPGENASGFAPTPRELRADHVWHGLDGIAVVVLRRSDPGAGTDITISDAEHAGLEITWPAAHRSLPGAPLAGIVGVATITAIATRRR